MRMRPRARERRWSRRARWCGARTMVRLGRHRLLYAGRWPVTALAGLVSVAALVSGLVLGLLLVALAPVAVVALWAAYALRWRRLEPAGGNGPDSPPGAGVREPRRPLPKSPAGAAERPHPVM